MSNFQPGDLALIVGGDDDYNIGKTVELMFKVKMGDDYTLECWPRTMINVSGTDVWIVTGDVRSDFGEDGVMHGFCQKAEFNIIPLKGDFAPEKTRQEELVL